MGQVGLGAYHLSIPIPKLQTRALVKINPSTKSVVYMIPRPKLGDDSIYTLGQGILPKNDCGRLRPHLSRAFHYGLRHPHKPLCSLFHASSRHLITTLNHINYNAYNHCTMQMFNFFLTCNHYLKQGFGL